MRRALALAVLALVACDREYDPNRFVLDPSRVDAILTLTPDASMLPADGFSRTRIVAHIVDSRATQRSVTFTTTLGRFPGGTKDTEIVVPADANGDAVAILESTRETGTAIVRATIASVTRQTEVTFAPRSTDGLVALTVSEATVPADDDTTTRVVARIAPELPADRRSVEFTTTVGEFAQSDSAKHSVPAVDASNTATVELRSDRIGTARVTAIVDGVSTETFIEFVRALPDEIRVSAAEFFIPARAGKVAVAATLVRRRGKPTENLTVVFETVTPSGDRIGHFSSVTPSKEGVATAEFSAEGVTYVGPATIRATVEGVTGSTEVRITPP